MRCRRDREPSVQEWAALCAAVMRCELVLERLTDDATLTEQKRRRGLATRLRKLQHEPAYRWLAVQPAYTASLEAFTRWKGDADAERLELLSAIVYSMESLCCEAAPVRAEPTRTALRRAVRHARELTVLVARDGVGFQAAAGDHDLLALLQRYIADNEKRLRGYRAPDIKRVRQLRFGRDVAHLLRVAFGAVPAAVLAPLLRLAGPPPSDRDIARLISQVEQEARMLGGATAPRGRAYVLDRILIAPAGKSRKSASGVKSA